jgi:hypothetical protein
MCSDFGKKTAPANPGHANQASSALDPAITGAGSFTGITHIVV